MTLLLFVVLPLGLARLQGVAVQPGFQLRSASPWAFILAAVLGCSLWPLAYDLIILCQDLGIATLSAEQLAEQPASARSTAQPLAVPAARRHPARLGHRAGDRRRVLLPRLPARRVPRPPPRLGRHRHSPPPCSACFTPASAA